MKVTAVANGYYDGKIRVPGEDFGLREVEDFSIRWMDSDEPKVLSYVRSQAKLKGKPETGMSETERVRENAITDRGERHSAWLKKKGNSDDEPTIETRRVNTGGTDGVVGAEIPKAGQRVPAAERIASAKALTGRDDITTAKQADEILAAAAANGSDNDDRTRDLAIDQTDNAPAPDAAEGDI